MNIRQSINTITFCLILFQSLSAQDIEYARRIIRDLSSPDMQGRGYIKKGDYKAAKYISREFKSIGLESFSKRYLQPFSIPVNTFPGIMQLKLNNRLLTPGKDYLISPESPSSRGNFYTCLIRYSDLVYGENWLKILGESSGKFIVIDKTLPDVDLLKKEDEERINEILKFMKMHPEYPASGTVLCINDKLSWKGSAVEGSKPFFIVNTDIKPSEIKSVSVNTKNVFYQSYQTHNLIGMLPGKLYPDSFIVFTAHYDHLGHMGKETFFPGANDNASGVSMLLNLAQYYAGDDNRPDYSMAFIALGAEEQGILGANFYADNPAFPLRQISFLINIDLAGNGEDGITVVNGTVYNRKFELLKKINDKQQFLPQVKARNEACNSDHCPFYKKGVPCFFIYTMGGSTAYHDIYDTADSLPLTMYENYFKLLKSFTDSLQVIH
jgi:aminopeptidase YwaD